VVAAVVLCSALSVGPLLLLLNKALVGCCPLSAGDHVGLYARNSSTVVAEAARCLGLPEDTLFRLHTDGEGAR
jgi:hypothetical protein